MRFPYLDYITEEREMTQAFKGYDHNLSCQEDYFYDMKNVTTEHYPMLSPRAKRGIVKTFTSFQGIVDKDELVWVDNQTLYIENVAKTLTGITLTTGEKTIEKMGAYLLIMPDKVWYNTSDDTYGLIEQSNTVTGTVSLTLCKADGTAITWHDAAYYSSHTPSNGDYKLETVNDKASLTVYSSTTGLWATVATTYFKIACTGIGTDIDKGDGIKVSMDFSDITWDYGKNIFVNEEDDDYRSNNFVCAETSSDYVIVTGLLDNTKSFSTTIKVERKMPDMSFIVECQNRIWGCSTDGHEIYCSKLGDLKNWNCFAGIATDSYAATIGSDGLFTGAYSYMGYPIFFKEESLLRVTVSSVGAHSYKEIKCRGIQSGSHKSLAQLNEILYYKSDSAVCAYDGSFPSEISTALGGCRYYEATGGSINNRYYISMRDKNNTWSLFCYDSKTGLWEKLDSLHVVQFARHDDDLYMACNNKLLSVGGTLLFNSTTKESAFDWMVESGAIGYSSPDKKHVSKINIRAGMEVGSHASIFIQYDSEGEWVHQFNISGKGTKSHLVSVRPHRCDHFKYRIVGYGDCKIYSITKTVREGSDA